MAFAYLFGSAATGGDRPGSDVDVAIFIEDSVPIDQFVDLSLQLSRQLEKSSGIGNIDVLVLNEATLPVLGRVIGGRVTIYSKDEPMRVRFESKTLREFFDFQIHARPLDQKFLRDIAKGRR